jgi:hypothetical protein
MSTLVPLIQHLSNPDFMLQLGRLGEVLGSPSDGTEAETADSHYCHCDCGQEVASSRKFVSQAHYNEYRARKSEGAGKRTSPSPLVGNALEDHRSRYSVTRGNSAQLRQ